MQLYGICAQAMTRTFAGGETTFHTLASDQIASDEKSAESHPSSLEIFFAKSAASQMHSAATLLPIQGCCVELADVRKLDSWFFINMYMQ